MDRPNPSWDMTESSRMGIREMGYTDGGLPASVLRDCESVIFDISIL